MNIPYIPESRLTTTTTNTPTQIDISARMDDYPQFRILSNLAHKEFVLDGIQFQCLEGFLQAVKTDIPSLQKAICAMEGFPAKRRGSKIDWWTMQTLYWNGKAYGRHTQEYQELIDRAFQACYDQCPAFRTRLAETGNATITHTIGKDDPTQTILTISEFVDRLIRLRDFGTLS